MRSYGPSAQTARPGQRDRFGALDDDPLWYRDAIIYQTHVRAFHDNDGDGIGDFGGLTQKLDYLQDLGVTAIWLLPFYPSPLKDDGYDIADYTAVHPAYGTLRDFQGFLREAHARGLRVITELVLNHTSDHHPWFQRARRSPPDSRWRHYYVWSETPDKYRGVRVIFKDFESSNWGWDPVASAYYWHRFYSHQPDLNFDSPEVHRALKQVVDHWLGMGVDGLRLDAVPYLFEREGTSCENLAETHQFLKSLRKHVDERFSNRMLLGEANQWPEDAVHYFGDGDECHMAFHFPVMPRLFMALQQEDRFPIVDIMQQTPAIPNNCQWALFLRNHDELTLEMVTDEDRDYMYRVYAENRQARVNLGIRRRLAPLMLNNRRRIELMNGLLFSLPGAPIIYYGDEIGMGDNIYLGDRNGVRTPMQWSGDRNAGFSRANPQSLYLPVIIDPEYHYETVNVEAQQNNPQSLLWWTKRLIALRKRYKPFSRGTLEFLLPENRKVLAFIRRDEDASTTSRRAEYILVVANLSRFVQFVELDLAQFRGCRPVELFGRTPFPPIGELPYFVTLGPHAFYWFVLEPEEVLTAPEDIGLEARRFPVVTAAAADERLFHGRAKASLEAVMPEYLRGRRWFGGKARTIQSVRVSDVIPVGSHAARAGRPARAGAGSPPSRPAANGMAYMMLADVHYLEGEPERYLVSVGMATGDEAERIFEELPHGVIARLHIRGSDEPAVVYEATWDRAFGASLMRAIARKRRFRAAQVGGLGAGEMLAASTEAFRRLNGRGTLLEEPHVLRGEQSNTSLVYGDRFILKLFRRPDVGVNPDLEIGRFLTEQAPGVRVPAVAGYVEYHKGRRGEPMTLGILQEFVPNEGDAWHYTLDALRDFQERVLTSTGGPDSREVPAAGGPLVELARQEPPEIAQNLFGDYLQSAQLLGRRAGEVHVALASQTEDPAFAPEPFTPHYQRSIYQSARTLAARVFPALAKFLHRLPPDLRQDARRLLELQPLVEKQFRTFADRRLTGLRIRTHGDFHLGQVLWTGKDFVIIDFEGEPARPLGERRLKRSPLRDVAGMVRSFHYAAYASLNEQIKAGAVHAEREGMMEGWLRFWHAWVSAAFLRAYLSAVASVPLLGAEEGEQETLFDLFVLEKAIYELGYEMNNRPDWVGIPVKGVLQLLEGKP